MVNDTGTVDIKINLDKQEKCLIFQHNGKCFTTKNIVCLISKVSSKERNDFEENKTTGKFGTGFLTTHLLYEKVAIEGLLQDYGECAKKIRISIDRSGETKTEIIKSVNGSFTQLENSKEIDKNIGVEKYGYNTKFIYQLDDEGMKIAESGIKSLYTSAPYITEEDIRSLLNGFSVITKNIPECKNFIHDFVKEVLVYKTLVEVIFNVGFNIIPKNKEFVIKRKIYKKEMRLYLRKSAYNT